MASNTLLTSVLNGGTNNHTTTSEEANVISTDFVTPGVVGAITLNVGSGGTGSYCVNADTSPDMGVTIKAGQAYIAATPSSQNSQTLRVRAAADYTAYTINSNASGSTKYDWIYLSISATNANNPSSDGSNVASFVTSRSSSNTADNGSPPTYGLLLAIVTVANGASSITNSNISDQRIGTIIGNANSSLNTFLGVGTFDFVASGLVWSGDSYSSTLNGSVTAGTVYIGGKPNSVAAVSGHAFTGSKDTYIDVLYSATGVGTLVYTEVTNNAASPALAANSLRIGIITTASASIVNVGSVNQGQETKLLPIASSIPYQVTDSLGNLICPRDPQRRIIGLRQIISDFSSSTNGSFVDVTGLNCTFIAPTSRKIKVTAYTKDMFSGSAATFDLAVFESSTQIARGSTAQTGTSKNTFLYAQTVFTPSVGSHTYKVSVEVSAGSWTLEATNTPAYLMVELV